MEILRYDEIDQQEAFMLNINALWFPFTPTRISTRIKNDDRWSRDSCLYLVDKGKILSQVAALRIPTKTVDGEETILGVAEVATHPAFTRKGYAAKLMNMFHDRSREEGIRIAFLLTRSSFVAYNLYLKLGYRDLVYFPKCSKPLVRKKKPKDSILRKLKKKDIDKLDDIFDRFSRDLLGFVVRQKRYFDWRLKVSEPLKTMIQVVETKDGVGGYILKRETGGDVFVEEMVVPSKKNLDRIFSEVERGEKGDYITVFPLGGRKQEEYMRSRGYYVDEFSFGTVMAAPLKRSLTHKEIKRLYGVNEGKFCMLELDEF
jgi:predicted acetyltransferase